MKFRIGGIALAAMMIMAAGVQAQTVQDIVGPWKMNIDAMGQQFDMTITFSESGGELTGLISSPRGDAPAKNVKLEGDQLSWDAEMGPTELSLKVTVAGDTFAGTSETPFGTVVLKGTKYTEEEIAAMGAKYDHLVGDWDTTTEFDGQTFESKLRLQVVDGRLMGAIIGGGGRQRPGDEAGFFVSLEGDTLRWDVQMPYVTQNGGEAVVTIADGAFEGQVTSELGEIPIHGSLVDTTKLVASPYDDPSAILGEWETVAEVNGVPNDVTLLIEEKDNRLNVIAESDIGDIHMESVEYNKVGDTMGVIRMTATIPEVSQDELMFELIIDGDTFEGEELNTGTILLTGKKVSGEEAPAPEALTGKHVMTLLDRDQSGTITMEESPEQLKQNFMMVDANADGSIDAGEAEMIAMFINGQYGGPGKGANEIIADMMIGMLDTDADGQISEDEVIIEEMKANFGAIDANSDGVVDRTEALAIGDFLMGAAESEEADGQVTGAMVMQMLDTDADGQITKDEAPEQLKQNFMMVDANGDGVIDASEAEVIAMFLNSQGGADALRPDEAPSEPGEETEPLTEEQMPIFALVEKGMTALVSADIDAMMDIYAEDFVSDQGANRAGQEQFLRDAQAQGFLDGIQYDLTPMEIVVDGDEATAGPIDLEGAFGVLSVEFELEKQPDGEWKVTYQTQY